MDAATASIVRRDNHPASYPAGMARGAPHPEVARVAAALKLRFDELVDRLTDRIAAEIDLYGSGAVVAPAELRRSVADNFTFMLGQMSTSDDPDLGPPRRTGRRRAQEGVPLPELLRAYRLGFMFLWEELLAEARAAGDGAVRALTDAAAVILSCSDEYAIALTEAYREAVSDRIVTTDRHRSALVEALVTGGVSDHGPAWEVAKLLDLPYEGRFVAVVAENTELGTEPLVGVEGRLAPHDVVSAWRLQPDQQVGVVSLGHRPVELVMGVLGELAAGRVGVSPTYATVDHTPRGGAAGPDRHAEPAAWVRLPSRSSTTARSARSWPRIRPWPATSSSACSAACSRSTPRTARCCWPRSRRGCPRAARPRRRATPCSATRTRSATGCAAWRS